MSESSAGNLLSGPADKIGHYFSVLSVVPSALLASWIVVLYSSQAWSRPPKWSAGLHGLASGGLTQVVQVGFFSLLIGLVLHPLQFALTQFFEGYWGNGELARALMSNRIRRHLTERILLEADKASAQEQLAKVGQEPRDPDAESVSLPTVPLLVRYDEAKRALQNYPHDANDTRPTRLGNILRRYEAAAGVPYGLGLVTVAPHLTLIAPPRHLDYLDDQRTQLDLAIRLIVVNILALVVSVLFLWRDGLWLVVALVPYALAYAFYRGSIVIAAEYGTALATVLDLNRFALYDALRLSPPRSSEEERALGDDVTELLRTDLAPWDRIAVDLKFVTSSAVSSPDEEGVR